MPYIDRDQAGNIVGIYANAQRDNHEWSDEAELWTPPQSKEQRIAALLAPIGLTQAWQLDGFMAGMVGGAATKGISEEQLQMVNPAYAQAVVIRNNILALLAEP